MDEALLRYVIQLRRPWLDDAMVFISALGGGGFIWTVIAAIASVFPARRAAAWRILLCTNLTWLLVDGVLKQIVHRSRPFDVIAGIQLLDQRPITSSFPSGHAAVAFAASLAAMRFFPTAGRLCWPLAVSIALSRLYLGVHWPTDVIAGMAIGLASATFILGGPKQVWYTQKSVLRAR